MDTPITFTATLLSPSASGYFRRIDNLTPDDSEAGGFAKLMRGTTPEGAPIAIKRFHHHEGEPEAYAADGEAARREFDCLIALGGADGHAPRGYALGTCTDKQGLTHHAIAMEYVEGFTIEQALSSGVLSGNARQSDRTHDILRAGRFVIDAIAACSRKVVHRDISPANVILVMNAAGEVDRAVLIDWGQSISTFNPLVTPALGSHRKLATICFGAPCVFGGPYYEERNKPSVDVYGFGALLYYMRTRKLPFRDIMTGSIMTPEQVELVAEAKREPLTLATDMPSMRGIERRLDAIIRACTAYDPAVRPTPEAVRTMIAEALGELNEGEAEAAERAAGAAATAGSSAAAAASETRKEEAARGEKARGAAAKVATGASTVLDGGEIRAERTKDAGKTRCSEAEGASQTADESANDADEAYDGDDLLANLFGDLFSDDESKREEKKEPEPTELPSLLSYSRDELLDQLDFLEDKANGLLEEIDRILNSDASADASSDDSVGDGASKDFAGSGAKAASDGTSGSSTANGAQTGESSAAASEDEDDEQLDKRGLFARAMDCFYGHGGQKRDAARSMQLLERAARKGDVDAMYTLGKNLVLGIGCKTDRSRGTSWLRKADRAGHPGAKALL